MHLGQTFTAILLSAAALTLPPAATAAAAAATVRQSQNIRARASRRTQEAPVPQTEITKEKVEAIISAVEQAAKKKDIAALSAYLAPDLKFKSQWGDKPTLSINRAQYIESVRLMFEAALDYVYLRKSLTVTISPDGQSATAQTEAFEMVTLAQSTVAGNVVEVTTFKIYKGKILIAAMEGTTRPV